MKHPLNIQGFNGTINELTKAITVMRYDKIAQLFSRLAKEFRKQSVGDGKKRRIQLSRLLKNASISQNHLAEDFQKIWRICKPYMKEKKK